MKNRNDEYWALVGELSRPPEALAGSVERARKRARRERRKARLGSAAASLAGLAAAFVLLVNVFPTFALACSGVPIVRELAAAVAFSPSLSAAVAHDYVQYIGTSQTVDGVTIRLEYAIVDRHQAVFFYSVEGDGRFNAMPSVTAADGRPVGGYATSTSYATEQEGLAAMTLAFTAGSRGLPDRFTLEMNVRIVPEQDQMSAPAAQAGEVLEQEEEENLYFAFEVTLDPDRVAEGKTIEAGQWVELDGQRILVDRLELFPTRTILYLGEDEANSAWLRSLKFWFEDGKGSRYDDTDGVLSATGESDSDSYLTYYFQSFYYSQPESLILCIGKAEWLEKDAPRVVLNLTTGEADGLPDGVEVYEITRQSGGMILSTGEDAAVKLLLPMERQGFGQTFGGCYWDPEGGQHNFNYWGSGTEFGDDDQEIGVYEMYYFNKYPWDTVELELNYTGLSVYEEPVTVPLF